MCSYLVATGKVEEECYRMHVVVNSLEYNKEYRKSEVLKELKSNMNVHMTVQQREKDKQKLLPQDRNSNTERIILCHVTKINSKIEYVNKSLLKRSASKMRGASYRKRTSKKGRRRRDEDSDETISEDDEISEDYMSEADIEDPVVDQPEESDEYDRLSLDFEQQLRLQQEFENGNRPLTRTAARFMQQIVKKVTFEEPKRKRGRPPKKPRMESPEIDKENIPPFLQINEQEPSISTVPPLPFKKDLSEKESTLKQTISLNPESDCEMENEPSLNGISTVKPLSSRAAAQMLQERLEEDPMECKETIGQPLDFPEQESQPTKTEQDQIEQQIISSPIQGNNKKLMQFKSTFTK